MDFKTMTTKQIAKVVVENTIAEKQASELKKQALAELSERGVEGIDAKVGKILGMIYKVNGSVSRIYDNTLLDNYLGDRADEFKKDKVNPPRYAVKLNN